MYLKRQKRQIGCITHKNLEKNDKELNSLWLQSPRP
jgi:hypothetical protein